MYRGRRDGLPLRLAIDDAAPARARSEPEADVKEHGNRMTSRIIVVDPFDYVVFGGTGDLARRKLLPALYHRELDGQLPEEARIIGECGCERARA